MYSNVDCGWRGNVLHDHNITERRREEKERKRERENFLEVSGEALFVSVWLMYS